MIINHEIYHPLYTDKDHFIILVTGGRASGKSFGVSGFLERLSFELKHSPDKEKIVHNILFSRYTMTSAGMSIIPEFMEKMEADGTQRFFKSTRSDITNLLTGSRIMFRGIRTSSGNQTAKLKSIHGITTFVCDEAEEWTSPEEFETIMFSIRQPGIQNRIIIIMNPTDSNHFIYQKYIKDTHRLVSYDGVPVQISTHPQVLHIHTTFLDNVENLSESFLKSAREMKERDPERYAHVFMGRWSDVAEGAIFKKWEIIDTFPANANKVAVGLDFGYSCFRGDTLITTDKGVKAIKDIIPGDMVLTRHGYRRVVNKFNNGIKRVNGKTIITGNKETTIYATCNHNFNANGQWKRFGELEEGDRLYILSNTKGSDTTGIRTASTPTITSPVKQNGDCTESYTKTTMEKSPKDIPSIISTRIRSIILQKTLWRSLLANTANYIRKHCRRRWNYDSTSKVRSQKTTGLTDVQKYCQDWSARQEFADIAESHSLPPTPIRDFAQNNVVINGNTQTNHSILTSNASGVDQHSEEINISSPNVARKNAHISCLPIKEVMDEGSEMCEVYDLEIEGVHEYFANGILVHNCDPSACVKGGVIGNDLYLDEEFYEQGMSIADLTRELNRRGLMVYADSADPRLIDEISNKGVMIYPVAKPPGSIIAGIEKVKDFDHVYVTSRSKNLMYELRNYVWAKDKNGNYINYPEGHDDHLMDSMRYYVTGCLLGKVIIKRNISKDSLGIW